MDQCYQRPGADRQEPRDPDDHPRRPLQAGWHWGGASAARSAEVRTVRRPAPGTDESAAPLAGPDGLGQMQGTPRERCVRVH